jgi:phospholipase/lecithinase/hemolysin
LLIVVLVLSVSNGNVVESQAAIFVFGDSLSDNGNLFNTPIVGPLVFDPSAPPPPGFPRINRFPTPPYNSGRASNGPVWAEQLAARLGMAPLLPRTAGGTNYAYISAVTREFPDLPDPVVSPFGAPSLDDQVAQYLVDLGTGSPSASDLHVVWGGANDYFFGQTDPSLPVTALSEQITALASAGATKFLVPNLPLLGRTPSGAASFPIELNILSSAHNALLDLAIDNLRIALAPLGVTIYELDVNQFFNAAIADPPAFGFEIADAPAVATYLSDVTDPQFGFPAYDYLAGDWIVDSNPERFLFWDGTHPTGEAHQLLGDIAFRSVIPEPSTIAIWSLLGLVGLGYGWRKRRKAA